jgi:hypothetical protein
MSKKIMFNDKFGLTQAVLDGRKTMTRRAISEKLWDRWTDYDDFCNSVSVENIPTKRQYYDEKDFFLNNAPYKLGEVVAIAQSYESIYNEKGLETMDMLVSRIKNHKGWQNKLFVAAGYMIHHIRITDIKIERLQDISDEDCMKEGIIHAYTNNNGIKIYHTPHTKRGYLSTDVAQEAFAFLINKVSGKGTWESNPYVFVYEFKLID